MAKFNFRDAFDLRQVDFYAEYQSAVDRAFYDNQPFTLGGKTYSDSVVLTFSTGFGPATSEYYGSGFVVSGGMITRGTVTAIYTWFQDSTDTLWYYNTDITGISIAASELNKAQRSVGRTDDAVLLNKILAKSDSITLSVGDDWIDGKGGNDTIRGSGGDDTLLGGVGNDVITGGQGFDLIIGGTGKDRLYGGSEPDSFVFTKGNGADIIKDFENSVDTIEIRSGAERYSDLRITATASGTLVRFGTDSILLEGVSRAEVDASDFLFT